jgi:ferredoxin
MKVKIDHEKCKSHFVCNLIAPSVFVVDPGSEYPIVVQGEIDKELEEDTNRAVLSCPEHAIKVGE